MIELLQDLTQEQLYESDIKKIMIVMERTKEQAGQS